CISFASSKPANQQQHNDGRRHADAFVSSPYRNNLLSSSPNLLCPAPPTVVAVPSLLSAGLSPMKPISDWHSNPIARRVRHKRQRLPPSLLIENASDPLFRCREVSCPRHLRSRLATIRPAKVLRTCKHPCQSAQHF